MKKLNYGGAKRLLISLAGLAVLGGCAVVPYNSGYYEQPVYGGPAVYAAPAYVVPSVNFGLNYRSGRGYGPRHYGHGHGRGRGWR